MTRTKIRAESVVSGPEKRIVKNGEPTNSLVFSASTDGNDRMFLRILSLYVKRDSIVADVTYGKGVFWRRVPEDMCDVRATDIIDGVDCRNLPYANGEIDCVVFDPPIYAFSWWYSAFGTYSI